MKNCFFFCIFFACFFTNQNAFYAQAGDFEWVKQAGSSGNDQGLSIATDNNGNVYTTGCFEGSVDFDPGASVNTLTSLGILDVFIQKLDSDGNFVWAVRVGANSNDAGVSLTTDTSGNIYVTGYFTGTVDFDPGINTYNLVSEGNIDVFILKLNSNGDFAWANRVGGTGLDQGSAIEIDANNNIYTCGYFSDSVEFIQDTSSVNLSSYGSQDVYIQKMDTDGNIMWVKQIGGIEQDVARGIAFDSNANVYIIGNFNNTVDFDPGIAAYNLTSVGNADVFIEKLDPNGNFIFAKQMGGPQNDEGMSIQVDYQDNIISIGNFQSIADFNPGNQTNELTSLGNSDIFILKLNSSGNFTWVKRIGAGSNERGLSVTLDQGGNIYTTGYFSMTVDFDPGTGTSFLTSVANFDGFIQKLDSTGNFVFAKKFGNTDTDEVSDLSLDYIGNIYITGYFSMTVDFDPGTGTHDLTSSGGRDIFTLKLSGTLGISDFEQTPLNVFPDPASDVLYITLNNDSNVTMLDVSGKLIQPLFLKEGTTGVDVSHLSPGIYFIQSINTKTIRFIKQ